MDDLLKELRATDADLAELSDPQLVAFLRCLVEALDERRRAAAEAVERGDRPCRGRFRAT